MAVGGRSLSESEAAREEEAAAAEEEPPVPKTHAEESSATATEAPGNSSRQKAEEIPMADPAEAMRLFLMNQAYWQAATQYGMIMSHATQLGLDVPFGSEMFSGLPHAPILSTPGVSVTINGQPAAQPEDPAAAAAAALLNRPPANAEEAALEAEINAQIAEFEGQGGMQRHLQMAVKLAFLVMLLHQQDSSSDRLVMLVSVAVFIFLMQIGALAAALEWLNLMPANTPAANTGAPPRPERPDGVVAELRLFFYGFFASVMPTWQAPEWVEEPEAEGGEASEAEGRQAGEGETTSVDGEEGREGDVDAAAGDEGVEGVEGVEGGLEQAAEAEGAAGDREGDQDGLEAAVFLGDGQPRRRAGYPAQAGD